MSAPSFDEHHAVEPHDDEAADPETDLDRPLEPAERRGPSWMPWDKIHMAMPHLMGLPAYGRPARNYDPAHRPFDPDALPLEAERDPDETADDAVPELRERAEPARTAPGSVPASDLVRGITSRLRRPPN